ncbi:MAG: VCBS repeat-containing protein [Candidatus Binatia bacterium]
MPRLLLVVFLGLLVPTPAGAQDCNGNGRPDAADLSPLAFRAVPLATGLPHVFGIVATDLDADGDTDLALTIPDAGSVTVLLNAGGATFPGRDTITVGDRPGPIVATSLGGLVFGGGSNVGLFVANTGDDSVTVLANEGAGTFREITDSPFAVGDGPTGLIVGDFDGDLDVDFVTTNFAGNTITVRRGDGVGAFLGPVTSAEPGGPAAATPVDVDRDGAPDLLLAHRTAGDVALRMNDGTRHVVATVDAPVALAAGDLSGDGDIDAVAATMTGDEIVVLENPGATPWTVLGTIPVTDPTAVVLADLDGDGLRDIATTSFTTGQVLLARNLGGGAFAAPVAIAVPDGPIALAAADLDLDGRRDLVVTSYVGGAVTALLQQPSPASRDCDASGVPDECELAGRDCNANGVPDPCDLVPPGDFAAPVRSAVERAGAITTGDADGDGRTDVVVATSRLPYEVHVFHGAGDGTVTPHAVFPVGTRPADVVAADLDGDGDLDVATSDAGDDRVSVLRLDGAGTTAAIATVGVGDAPGPLLAVDLDGDGDRDLVVANTGDATVTTLRNAAGTFTGEAPAGTAGTSIFALAAGDLDGDGDADVIVVTVAPGTTALQVLRNTGGVLAVEPSIAALASPDVRIGVALGDFDGDGDADLASLEVDAIDGEMRIRVLRNDRGAGLVPLDRLPVPGSGRPLGSAGLLLVGGNTARMLLATDLDADGDADLAVTDADGTGVRVFPNTGGGHFGGGIHVPVPGRLGGIVAADLDGDGADDLATVSDHGTLFVAASRRIPAARDCTADGVPDVCEASYSDCNANALPDTCEPAAVDGDGDGIPDCVERGTACRNCRDDDGDGALDLADDACTSTPFADARLTAAPARGRRPGRLTVAAELSAALGDLATDPPVVTVTVGDSTLFCRSPALRRQRHRFRLATQTGALRALVVSVNARRGRTKLRATLRDAALAPADGAAVSVALHADDTGFRTAGTLRAHGTKKLVGP